MPPRLPSSAKVALARYDDLECSSCAWQASRTLLGHHPCLRQVWTLSTSWCRLGYRTPRRKAFRPAHATFHAAMPSGS